ncbi:lipid A biosynthesis lauroyl acyltransferase [Siccirubricoccus phaeus]|uniref:lipid A biosynthesis lauroyl acyltransferase n=1 Tax=Siccirubricoccus phaeus TaxID=2595053 RepID=UPI0011F2DCC9|nr:lipid A biosynthesis lauroyl acyltransferase [Siccirubricoccus phaeus]
MQRFLDSLLALLVRALFALLRALGPDRASALGGFLARNLGPLLPVQRTTLDNIARAFPELPAAEHRRIALEAWDNLGRTACEYVHMDRIWDFDEANPNTGRIQLSPETVARFIALREDNQPGLFFAAHLANWELPAIAAAAHGLDSAVLYRMPNNAAIGRLIVKLRAGSMGRLIPTNISAPVRMLEALDEGLHVGMLVDQRFSRGPRIAFFGRETPTNPLLARLARRFDCPVHGVHAIRLGGARFRLELTEPVALPRDAKGEVDINAATDAITRIVESWIRDYPGQWLWMHRRWR